ncbi:ZIP family metal transporter [Candidatus Beckwithbacteria bacterium CG23_combo_of_CG06-09_8_20_14_all_47_9]|uniref:ZIP family metal transporter n=1 Tax=Candidatus Beckwithbacteria bacterium CG23_combo_of_CG06-09_8_20_14_all_47_9 TaxID=1974498 RepID=A0A2H0B6A7_9BACT|nr:MAG: ZIP family metal transporter [Candidatus Beckwithbacteria bacterium CG23_combo_of_CG06-09_8_20_14_all_47_9]
MSKLIYIILASGVISLGALAGVLTLAINEAKLTRALMLLVSLSAGAMMGGAFLHLLPEAVEVLPPDLMLAIVLLSFMGFFLVEKLVHWRHCHKGHCPTHTFGYLNLIGDAVHNFIDGLIIAAAFLTDIRLGLVTATAVALHEIPQEIGDFGVLLYSGFTKTRALTANFLVALTVVLGGVIGYYLSFWLENLVGWLLPVAAGGFIYIAASDLMPEIRKEPSLKKSLIYFVTFLAGAAMMYLVK